MHKNILSKPDTFLRIIEPYKPDIAVAVECIFTWYWIAPCVRIDVACRSGKAA